MERPDDTALLVLELLNSMKPVPPRPRHPPRARTAEPAPGIRRASARARDAGAFPHPVALSKGHARGNKAGAGL